MTNCETEVETKITVINDLDTVFIFLKTCIA